MLKVFLNKQEEQAILAGFPWVYNNEVHHFEGEIKSGEVCMVFDFNQSFFAYGFNTNSKIMVRILR